MVQHEEVELWEQIFSRSNLFSALARVQANKGAPGVDGMTVEALPEHLKANNSRVPLDFFVDGSLFFVESQAF